MADLEQIQRQFLFPGEVLVQRGIGVAALAGDITDAGGGEPVLAEQLHGGAENFPLGRGIVLANVEGKHGSAS
jgi:hypothetical protein